MNSHNIAQVDSDTTPTLDLLFVSPRFLFPVDSGGKIRTTQTLRGMKRAGNFRITLLSPAPVNANADFSDELAAVCDRFVSWPESAQSRWHNVTRLRHALSSLPIPVATDCSNEGSRLVQQELAKNPSVVVFDFAHAAVLAPANLSVPSVMFTHNVEAEIFARHVQVAKNPLAKMAWQSQYKKLLRFEKTALQKFDSVVAVSKRDRQVFEEDWGIANVADISTGVDLDFFNYEPPKQGGGVVFTGSMDWLANIDGIEFLLDDIWPIVAQKMPSLEMTVVGRNPPQSLVSTADKSNYPWHFTGFVDDVRPYVHKSSVYVIPLRVGGGTRLKVFEAMAMGSPIVSTALGVEGLPLEEGTHYLRAETPNELAEAVLKLAQDPVLGQQISEAAYELVKQHFSFEVAAGEFEQICLQTVESAKNVHSQVIAQ